MWHCDNNFYGCPGPQNNFWQVKPELGLRKVGLQKRTSQPGGADPLPAPARHRFAPNAHRQKAATASAAAFKAIRKQAEQT
jgi:hypothetical protein